MYIALNDYKTFSLYVTECSENACLCTCSGVDLANVWSDGGYPYTLEDKEKVTLCMILVEWILSSRVMQLLYDTSLLTLSNQKVDLQWREEELRQTRLHRSRRRLSIQRKDRMKKLLNLSPKS